MMDYVKSFLVLVLLTRLYSSFHLLLLQQRSTVLEDGTAAASVAVVHVSSVERCFVLPPPFFFVHFFV